MKSSLFNEEDADIIVRAVMILHNKRLIIINGEDCMGFIKGEDGKVYQVVQGQEVTRDSLLEREHAAAVALSAVRDELAEFDKLNEVQPSDGSDNQASAGADVQPGQANEQRETPAPAAETPSQPTDPATPEGTEPQSAPQAATPEQTNGQETPPASLS